MQENLSEPAGIYIHIPFCAKKCPYCGFYSTSDLSLKKAFLKALMFEIRILGNIPVVFDTIYIGGGTPSTLTSKDIGKIIEKAIEHFRISADVEITLEVNPGTVDQERFYGYKSAGVNRINIGAQSFQKKNLSFLGRIHSEKGINQAIKWARKAGFDNMGLDLIYGIPGQTKNRWLLDLQKAVDIKAEHLSCYMLTFEPGTSMYKDRLRSVFCPLSDAFTADLFELTVEFLGANNYVQYEISNFALDESEARVDKNDYRSRHNRKYWMSVPYIGLGPSAHSFVDPVRYWNISSVKKYIKCLNQGRLPIEGREVLSREQEVIEAVSLGLRMREGIETDAFDKKFDTNFKKIFAEKIKHLEEDGLMKLSDNRCSLTKKGMLFADSITSMLI